MLNYFKQIFYTYLFDFPFFQKLFYINDKLLFFNLTFFFRKKQLFKKKVLQKARISFFTLFINKIKQIQFNNFTLTSVLNYMFKLFVKILKNFIFSLILVYYFVTFLVNLFLLLIKFFYFKFLKIKLFFYKNCYDFLDYFGFRVFFFFYNIGYFFFSTTLILLIFVGFFYFFKINYFNTDYFYVNFFPYNNNFDTNFLSSKQIYYYRFSLWWIFRIYLLYTLLYIFVKDLRDLIKTHLMFIIFLPIVICNLNFKFFIYLMLSSVIDVFGSTKINRDQFFIKRLKKKLPYKRLTLGYTNRRFNFLFSSGLVQENRRLRVLQTSANNNLEPVNVINLNSRDESTSYKSEILRLKKFKAIQNYYLDFKIISKKNKVLQTIHSDLLKDKLLYGLKPSENYYFKFFYTSNFYTINKKNDVLNLLKKNTNGLIKVSPYLDIKLLNTDNYRTFKTNNYFVDNRLFEIKLEQYRALTGEISDVEWTAYNKNFNINYNKVNYIYDLFYELNNKKLKRRASQLILSEKFENVIDNQLDE